MVETITDPEDPRVREYVGLTDLALRTRSEPELGLYLAESEKVIRRALAAGHQPISYLMAPRWLADLADLVAAAEADGVPVFVVPRTCWRRSPASTCTGGRSRRCADPTCHRSPR
jgi:hypothetical protein